MTARSLFVVLVAGCGAAVPALPSKGGPAWIELQSEHFTLWTDSSRARGRELIREMEDLRQIVIGIGFPGASGAGRNFVIALRDDDEVAAFMPGEFAAMASLASSYIRQPMILLAAESKRDPENVIAAHELTHTISQAVIRNQPRWFAEGIAKYFETIAIDRRAGTADLGRAPTHRGQPFVMVSLMPLEKVFACNDLTCVDGHFYASAWALFTFLTNTKNDELVLYEKKLVELNDPDRAWRETFGRIPLSQLEMEMRRWIAHGTHKVLHYAVQLRNWPVEERVLSDADVLAARALMRLQFQERRDDAKDLAQSALALDANHVLARVVLHEIAGGTAVDVARALAKARPEDWRAWWLLAAALKQGDEAAKARHTACELIAKNPAIVPPWQPCQ